MPLMQIIVCKWKTEQSQQCYKPKTQIVEAKLESKEKWKYKTWPGIPSSNGSIIFNQKTVICHIGIHINDEKT